MWGSRGSSGGGGGTIGAGAYMVPLMLCINTRDRFTTSPVDPPHRPATTHVDGGQEGGTEGTAHCTQGPPGLLPVPPRAE